MRVLIDTNILIDYFGQREPYFPAWEKLHAMQIFGDLEIWVAPQSYADAFYILNGQVESAALQAAFVASLDYMHVVNVGHKEVCEASMRSWASYEDCLIALCAENIAADHLLTRDAKGFESSSVPPCTPEQFLHMVETEYGITYDTVDLG